ncbi:MAG TPA: fibronectin type III domain-containing protein [Thermoanaerobaculia bacterium]|nr:fibronectin type III domain-containing protein [Thermoanaerobaculia bacterium]
MRPPVRRAVLLFLLLFGLTLSAQPAFFGRPYPPASQALFQFGEAATLTNARYENSASAATFASNGRDAVLVWPDDGAIRASAIRDDASGIAQRVLAAYDTPSVAWTGSSFVVAAANKIRFLDTRGVPVSPEITRLLPERRNPRVASNGKNIILLAHAEDVRTFALTLGGALVDAAGTFIDRVSGDQSAITSNGSGYAVITSSTEAVRVTLLDEGGVLRSQHWIAASPRAGTPAIASDGRDYLAVWSDQNGTVSACAITANGTAGAPFIVASPNTPESVSAGAVTWNGSRYTVAYTVDNGAAARPLQIITVTAAGVLGAAQPMGLTETTPSLARVDGRLLLASSTREWGVLVSDPDPNRRPFRGAVTAKNQMNVATATSANATLFVWHERMRDGYFDARLGIRDHEGSWRELGSMYRRAAFAVSDGIGFLTGGDNGDYSWVSLHEGDGSLRSVIEIPFDVTDAAWNGREYVVVGREEKTIVAASVSTSGALSPTVLVRANDGYERRDPRAASDGTNVLVVWLREDNFSCFPPCAGFIVGVGGALLAPDLSEVVTNGITIDAGPAADSARVTWDGSQYAVVYWNDGLFARHVSRQGAVSSTTPIAAAALPPATPMPLSVSRVGNAAGIAFAQSATNELRLFQSDGSVTAIGTFPIEQRTSFQFLMPLIASLPDGRIAYVAPRYVEGSPHFGSDRLTFAIGDVAPPPRIPDPPKLSMTFDSNDMHVTWTQTDGANGYRLEHKLGDEDWSEIESWFDNGDQRLTVILGSLLSTKSYGLRVRAWGDGGVSAYSTPILLGAKRRAVR